MSVIKRNLKRGLASDIPHTFNRIVLEPEEQTRNLGLPIHQCQMQWGGTGFTLPVSRQRVRTKFGVTIWFSA